MIRGAITFRGRGSGGEFHINESVDVASFATAHHIGLLRDRMRFPNLWFHLRMGILNDKYRTAKAIEMHGGLFFQRAPRR
jgi:hypothetical protein